MRAKGLLLREIAERLGVSKSTALRWTDPEREELGRELNRAWKDRNRERVRAYNRQYQATHEKARGTCSSCGGRTSRQNDGGVCMDCRSAARCRRAERIVAMWASGLAMPEIAERLELSMNTLRGELGWARARGYDLPYRYRVRERASS